MKKHIIVTGGAGFIGSALIWRLNQFGYSNIIAVDDLGTDEKWKNLSGLLIEDYIEKDDFINTIRHNCFKFKTDCIFHLGACSSTTETDARYLIKNNFEYTKSLAVYSLRKKIRFIYASSAATYGDGSNGYDDNEAKLESLRPLNMYAYSKQLFDLWAKKQRILNSITGIKYFNVFGPNERHKDSMRSMVCKGFEQIRDTGKLKLFKSHHPDYKDGEQLRDFIYVKDAVDMTLFFYDNPKISGIYNVGTGATSSWNQLADALFKAMDIPVNIEYIDMPESLRPKYQYYTKAEMTKLTSAGYNKPLLPLEEAINDYVKNYLQPGKYLAD